MLDLYLPVDADAAQSEKRAQGKRMKESCIM